jgi:hypothetical protein
MPYSERLLMFREIEVTHYVAGVQRFLGRPGGA